MRLEVTRGHVHCLPPSPKNSHTLNISSDRLLLSLRSVFAVPLFRQPYAMSQHLFPLIFILSCINIWSRCWWQESQTIPSVFFSTPQRLLLGCGNDSSCSTLSQQHQIITLQFADLNQNDNFFGGPGSAWLVIALRRPWGHCISISGVSHA